MSLGQKAKALSVKHLENFLSAMLEKSTTFVIHSVSCSMFHSDYFSILPGYWKANKEIESGENLQEIFVIFWLRNNIVAYQTLTR